MKAIILFSLFLPILSFAKIEDNSFLIEEAFNQEKGVYQFIQRYFKAESGNGYVYNFENEIPITDEKHQFSYEVSFARANGLDYGSISDLTLNYRYQVLNRDGLLLTERIGLIVPTGNLEKGTSAGVYGLEFVQAASITISDKWMSHWNFGFTLLPNAKTPGLKERGTMTGAMGGTSLVYLFKDNFNFLFEAILESGQFLNNDRKKSTETSLTLNPGFRWAWDYDWKETQIVPGISFPTDLLSPRSEYGVLLYLSVEPKFF